MDFGLDIPRKSVFKADEVCGITGVRPYVLRFWENEFSGFDTTISSSGHRLYNYDEVVRVFKIKKLLFEDKLSVTEAKGKLFLEQESKENLEDKILEEIVEDKSLLKAEMGPKIIPRDIQDDLILGGLSEESLEILTGTGAVKVGTTFEESQKVLAVEQVEGLVRDQKSEQGLALRKVMTSPLLKEVSSKNVEPVPLNNEKEEINWAGFTGLEEQLFNLVADIQNARNTIH